MEICLLEQEQEECINYQLQRKQSSHFHLRAELVAPASPRLLKRIRGGSGWPVVTVYTVMLIVQNSGSILVWLMACLQRKYFILPLMPKSSRCGRKRNKVLPGLIFNFRITS